MMLCVFWALTDENSTMTDNVLTIIENEGRCMGQYSYGLRRQPLWYSKSPRGIYPQRTWIA